MELISHASEGLLIVSNFGLLFVTYLVVPEEHKLAAHRAAKRTARRVRRGR